MSLVALLIRSSRWSLWSALASSILAGLSSAALVALLNESLEAGPAQLPRLGLQFAALSLGMLLFRWLSQVQFVGLSEGALARLRMHVSRHLVDAPYRHVEEQGAARWLAVLIEDVGTVAEFFVTLPRLVMQGAVVLGCLVYLAALSGQAFAFALGMMLAGSLVHYAAVRRAGDRLERARLEEDQLYERFRGLFAGAKELRQSAPRREAFLSQLLAGSVESVRQQRTQGLLTYVAAGSWGAFLFFVVIGGVIFGLGAESSVRSGYALIFLYMMHPMEALLEAIPEIGRTRVALDGLRRVGVGSSPVATEKIAPVAAVGVRRVRLRGVTHSYRRDSEDGLFALGPLDLELEVGEVVFLIGGNGSGKTTLAKLLVGLYTPESGQVFLDDMPVTADQSAAYRETFSCVFSDFHLFDSLLGMASPGLDEQGRSLLEALHLEHKVSLSGGVFSTTELSLGQRKRLALLVACLEDRPIYVFDEWAADQDPAYKQVFYEQVLPWLRARGKAVLVVTHDDRYFHLADRRLELVSGKLCAPDPAASARRWDAPVGPASSILPA